MTQGLSALSDAHKCPCCDRDHLQFVTRIHQLPTRTSLVYRSKGDAINCPRGDIELVQCLSCGFMWNTQFDEALVEYSDASEESQNYSNFYTSYMQKEIAGLVEKEKIRGKTILEIGCGKGDFLAQICALGNNTGIGYDPTYQEGRYAKRSIVQLTFRKRFFTFESLDHDIDLIVLRMTLEHIESVGDFIGKLVEFAKESGNVPIYITLPNSEIILTDQKFCDVVYEHVNYFTRASMRAVFERFGYGFQHIQVDFNGQHLLGVAERLNGEVHIVQEQPIIADARSLYAKADIWGQRLETMKAEGKSVVMWGSGSKATAFFNQVEGADCIRAVIDINPYRHNTFVAGLGIPVVPPSWLEQNSVDIVIIRNPIYTNEIIKLIRDMGLSLDIMSLD